MPNPEKRGVLRRFAAAVVLPPTSALTRRVWLGQEHLPKTGGVVVAANHLSEVDPVVLAHYVYGSGRFPRFLGKDSVFRVPVVGRLLLGVGQIPVKRETGQAVDALRAAVDAVRDGACVVVYPEATITHDPGLWPMTGKSGAVRIALEAGVPVVPVGQWGAQEILAYKARRPRLLPPKRVRLLAGPPVDLSAYEGKVDDAAAMTEATDVVMRRIAELVGKLRGERPPDVLFDRYGKEAGE